MANKLKITQVKSAIGRQESQKRTVVALGLKKLGSSVIQDDTPVINGMIYKVRHLLSVETIAGE